METLSDWENKYLGLVKLEEAFTDSSLEFEKSRIIPNELLASDPSSATEVTRISKNLTT